MNAALRSVACAWRWILGLFVLGWIVAAVVGTSVRVGVRASLDGFIRPDDRILAAWIELLGLHLDLVIGAASGWLAAAFVAAVTTTLVVPGLIVRLGGEARFDAIAARWAGTLWPQIATTLWNWLLRAAVLLAVVNSVGQIPAWLGATLLAAVVLASTAALDIARTAVVLHEAPGTSMRCAIAAFVALGKRPRTAAILVGLQLATWALAGLGLAIAVRSGGDNVWPMRAIGLIAVALGALRLRIASDLGPLAIPSRDR